MGFTMIEYRLYPMIATAPTTIVTKMSTMIFSITLKFPEYWGEFIALFFEIPNCYCETHPEYFTVNSYNCKLSYFFMRFTLRIVLSLSRVLFFLTKPVTYIGLLYY